MSSQSGNTRDSGNKGSNYPWQKAVLKLLGMIASGSGGAPVVRVPAILRATAAGAVAVGKKSVSFYNAGNANAIVLGQPLKPGEQITYSAESPSDTVAAITYDGTGTDLLITTLT